MLFLKILSLLGETLLAERTDWKRKMGWLICLKMSRPGQRQQALQQDQRLRLCWESKLTTIQAQLQANNRNYQQLQIEDSDLLLCMLSFCYLELQIVNEITLRMWECEKGWWRGWAKLRKGRRARCWKDNNIICSIFWLSLKTRGMDNYSSENYKRT